ncbi:hypothetical protein FH972_003410 [Carpinus fangiana]|uniref:Uncharacterized protein n=1 Tax=Carpinus fangiana TaxID=176857 RepID=A0A5N6QIC9_9ROSI|nr:hypothetical protein FH972_003410 [Carpinus fangiana]
MGIWIDGQHGLLWYNRKQKQGKEIEAHSYIYVVVEDDRPHMVDVEAMVVVDYEMAVVEDDRDPTVLYDEAP